MVTSSLFSALDAENLDVINCCINETLKSEKSLSCNKKRNLTIFMGRKEPRMTDDDRRESQQAITWCSRHRNSKCPGISLTVKGRYRQ